MQELSLWADTLNLGGAEAGVIHYPETGQSLRWMRIDGVPWLHFPDLCKGTGHSNPSSAINLVEEEDKKKIDTRSIPAGHPALNFLRAGSGNSETWFVNEDGFMTMGLAGRGDGPRMFRRWVVKVVIPAFRAASKAEAKLDELEVAERYVAAIKQKRALEAVVVQQAKELDAHRPRVQYVETFVDPGKDNTLFRTFCGQANLPERKLREHLVAKKVIYKKCAGREWNKKTKRWEDVYEWDAHAKYKTWFHRADQPDAPRLYNNQMRTTLYVTPVGKVAILNWLTRNPIEGAV